MKIESGFPGERILVIPQVFLDIIADDPLTGDLYIHSLGHIAHAKDHYVERKKGCKECIFIYCTWGKGHIQVGRNSFALLANQFVVLPANISHTYFADKCDPWSFYWVRFAGEKAKIYAKDMVEPYDAPPSIYSRIEERIVFFEDAYAVLCSKLSIERMRYANICFMHFISSFQFLQLFKATEALPTHIEGLIGRVTHYMNENVECNLTLRDFAQYVGYSDSYFYRQFMKKMGTAPINYFIKLKINKASIYLIKTQMSIAQISAKLGFNSAGYFSRMFTKIIGISPSEFRKQDFQL